MTLQCLSFCLVFWLFAIRRTRHHYPCNGAILVMVHGQVDLRWFRQAVLLPSFSSASSAYHIYIMVIALEYLEHSEHYRFWRYQTIYKPINLL